MLKFEDRISAKGNNNEHTNNVCKT